MKAEKQWQEGTSLKFNFCTDEIVSKSSTAAAVKQVLRRSMLGWGLPEAVRTDNGKDYVDLSPRNRAMTRMRFPISLCIRRSQDEEEALQRRANYWCHQAA